MVIDVENKNLAPLVVVLDFTLVLGIDSSAAQAIAKVKDALLKNYQVELCVFVPGSDQGFPTEFKLSDQLSSKPSTSSLTNLELVNEETSLLPPASRNGAQPENQDDYSGSHVCDSLDLALIYAENALVARQDPTLLHKDDELSLSIAHLHQSAGNPNESSLGEEKEMTLAYLKNVCPSDMEDGDPELLFSLFDREVYRKGQFVWKQHSSGDCAKLLIVGTLIAELENEAGTTETILKGNMIGELGLINGDARNSSVRCLSEEAILYSMSRASFEDLIRTEPRVARYIDLICVRYLALRVQHVSNRIFETRCLPI
jgi:SulP family sulfate permease